jgi:predicted enzyme related to lactoylglutathione lyase
MEPTRDNKIDYIEFTTSNIQAAKDFYARVFGWTFVDYGPDYTSFSDGKLSGGFSKGELSGPSSPLVVIYVDDLKAAEQRVKDAGGKITKETFSFPGGSRFHFKDPTGNELSVWHND